MTVKELKDILAEFDDKQKVYIVQEDGNSFDFDYLTISPNGDINLMIGEFRG